MNDPQRIVFSLATLCGVVGMWLLLPRGAARGRAGGAVLLAVAAALWASQLSPFDDYLAGGLFYVLAGVTVAGAAGTVGMQNPVYAAIWFGMTLLGTAGLYLFSGAQFLAVATVIVYAGAILVTFLFVLMLAQPEGRAPYDRRSWEALVSAAAGMVVVGILSMTICGVFGGAGQEGGPLAAAAHAAGERPAGVLAEQHVARLGAELFGRHLIAVEVAGTLLLAALVGAAVIVARPGAEEPPPTASRPEERR